MKDVAFWSEYRANIDSKACDGDNRRTQESNLWWMLRRMKHKPGQRGKGPSSGSGRLKVSRREQDHCPEKERCWGLSAPSTVEATAKII